MSTSNLLSPGVKVFEKDNINYNINPSNIIAIFVGEFEKWPIEKPVFITDILQFKLIFGRATESNYNQWYQVYNFLQYSSNLYVCRAAGQKIIASSNNGNIANSPGEWGDILTVEIYKSSDYFVNNLFLFFNANLFLLFHYWLLLRFQSFFFNVFGYVFVFAISWSGTQFVAVGAWGKCVTSPDGVTWTNQASFTTAFSTDVYAIKW